MVSTDPAYESMTTIASDVYLRIDRQTDGTNNFIGSLNRNEMKPINFHRLMK